MLAGTAESLSYFTWIENSYVREEMGPPPRNNQARERIYKY
jgi:hypothetical protein